MDHEEFKDHPIFKYNGDEEIFSKLLKDKKKSGDKKKKPKKTKKASNQSTDDTS